MVAEEKDTHDYHNSDLCSDLHQQFGEIRKVINIESVSEEQLNAIGSLRVFLVEEFDCFDEFEKFEWD